MVTPKGRATRDRIVTAAASLMCTRGVTATSTEDVQVAANVSASQIYHYFADKRSLTRAVIEHQTDAIVGSQESLLVRLDDLDALRAWAEIVVGYQRNGGYRGGCPLGTLASELAENDTEAREDLAAGYRRWQEAIRAGLAAMADRGEFLPGTDIERLAIALLAALQGGLLLSKTLRDGVHLETALNTMIDHIESFTTAGTQRN
ncbi:MAG: TetR family transcriptional regulator [Mycobacterium sp.]|jgi:AcrR family transcriptional regulator|nr:TetR family transcriptional regulator [Mycobacterium sp.]MCW2551473.1 TetR family transcriptional regulator [Mycobacterium sp.]MDT5311567.1 TetR/AcrR family transcriptional regulator, transcriptional repressor for nem operon [Mycobacterium sp.]